MLWIIIRQFSWQWSDSVWLLSCPLYLTPGKSLLFGMYLVSLLPIVTSLFFYSLQLFLYLYIRLWALFTPFPLCFAPCPLHGAQLTPVVCPLGSVFCIFQFALSKWQWSNSVIASANYTQTERLDFSQNSVIASANYTQTERLVFSQLNCCILFYRTEYYRFLNLSNRN